MTGREELLKELRHHERDYPELIHGPLCGRAADEIERLCEWQRARLETDDAVAKLTQRPADCGAWQDIATAPGDANVLIDYDGVVVIGGFNAVSKEWTDGEDYIPLKDIRGWMPLPRTSRISSTTRGGEA